MKYEPTIDRLPARELDPAHAARSFLSSDAVSHDGVPRLRRWRGSWYWWAKGAYRAIHDSEVTAWLVRYLNDQVSGVTVRYTNDVKHQIAAISLLPSTKEPPAWLDQRKDNWQIDRVISVRNGIVNLKRFAAGESDWKREATARLFTTTALDYDLDDDMPTPEKWLAFLDEIWGDDPDTIDALQEICGYLISGATELQKIFLLVGPKRSGKGTIARVLRGLLGPANVAGPTLASLATNFGLAPLVGKTLAVVGDARMGRRGDYSVVVERLLMISGEDNIDVDRKFRETVSGKLPTRLMLLTNEVPRLPDASGALASRFLMLRLTKSFFGAENPRLTDELLAELPGIFQWACEGLIRLQSRGRFTEPTSSKELHAELEDLASPVAAFVRDECDISLELTARVGDLFNAWKLWCEAKGMQGGTEQHFGKELRAAFPGLKLARPRAGDGPRFRAYAGIGIRSQAANF